MPSFYIPLSGLNADSTALNTIANNLSNMNTTGFKAQTTNFNDLLYQQIGTAGSGDGIEVGTGVAVANNESDFSTGSIASTGIDTDAAIDGTGFFVLNDGNGGQLYTQDGNFQTSSTGLLESSGGLAVQGYAALNGAIDTGAGLTNLSIPTIGTTMAPNATTSFSVTQNLDSADSVGTSTSSPVTMYDSLGQSYTGTITYTKTGTNQWSYGVTMPDTLAVSPAAAATATESLTPTTAVSGTNTIYTYNFGASGGTLPTGATSGTLGTVDGTSTLSFGGTPVVIPAGGESVSALGAQINALGVAGVSATVSGGVLSVTSPTATAVVSSVNQDLNGATINYAFGSSGPTLSTVNPGTNLAISGLTATGSSATITAPTVTSGESLATYAADLTTALTNAGIVGVTATDNAGTLSISGANMTTSGSVIQDPVASANATGTLTFNADGNLVSPAANVNNITFGGLADGAAGMNLTWDMFGANGTGSITQTASADLTSATNQNGFASGQYNGTFTVGSNGIITADYSNGETQTVGQLALATVTNLQGMNDVGATEYQTTAASGSATVAAAGTGGLGTIEGDSLEASNVNISAEFSDLIVAQRAFEANAKSVTTFDTITQETINMIH